MRKQYTAEKRESMAQIGARLHAVRKESGLSLGEIADRLNRDFGANTNKGMLSKYENGIHEPSASTIYCLSRILGVSGDYILGKTDQKIEATPPQGVEATGFCIRICTGITGDEKWNWDESITHLIPKEWLVGGREFFGFKVSGSRFAPRYYDGDIIIFERKYKTKPGQTIVVKVGGGDAFLARVSKKREGKEIIPLDPALPAAYYSTEQLASIPVKIIGVSVELRRDEGEK